MDWRVGRRLCCGCASGCACARAGLSEPEASSVAESFATAAARLPSEIYPALILSR